jgi:anti-anti-sigma factor
MGVEPPVEPGLLDAGSAELRGEVVHVTGEVDWCNVAVLRSALAEATETIENGFLVDLTEVTFMDSGALAALFEVVDRRPCVRARTESVAARVLTITGFGDLGLLELVD